MVTSEFSLLADYVNQAEKGKLNISGLATRWTPPGYPFTVPPMYLVSQLTFSMDFDGKTVPVSVAWKTEDGEILSAHSAMIQIANLEEEGDTHLPILTPAVEISRPGRYQAVLSVEDVAVASAWMIAKPALTESVA